MDELITTCVQQQVRVFENQEEFRNDVQRFMRLAKVKESHLVVFPELSGLLLAPPLAPGLKRTLLRVAERQVKKKPSLFDKVIGRAADSAAEAMGGISKNLADIIIEHESVLREAYLSIFSEIAREYNVYIVGGSIYLPDNSDGQIHNMAYLFGPTGEALGHQSKINLSPQDRLFCQPAVDGLKVFETDFGKLGILIGQDILYPETSRILAHNDVLLLVNLLASTSHALFLKMRHAFSTRLQENLFLGMQSCLVGKNFLGHEENDYVGRSSILAPLEMTTRYSGVLAEVGAMGTESIVSTIWDIGGLRELRSTTDTPTYLIPDNEALRLQIGKIYGGPEEEDIVSPATVSEEVAADESFEPETAAAESAAPDESFFIPSLDFDEDSTEGEIETRVLSLEPHEEEPAMPPEPELETGPVAETLWPEEDDASEPESFMAAPEPPEWNPTFISEVLEQPAGSPPETEWDEPVEDAIATSKLWDESEEPDETADSELEINSFSFVDADFEREEISSDSEEVKEIEGTSEDVETNEPLFSEDTEEKTPDQTSGDGDRKGSPLGRLRSWLNKRGDQNS